MGSDKRKESRHTIPIDVLIEVFGANGELSQGERTVTENINRQGAAVFTTLDVTPGHFVKVTSEQYATSRLAVVRAAAPDRTASRVCIWNSLAASGRWEVLSKFDERDAFE